jgi:putative ABC transport system permease protein
MSRTATGFLADRLIWDSYRNIYDRARDQDRGEFAVAEEGGRAPYDRLTAEFQIVTSGYFETMGIPVRLGRIFAGSDTAESQRVVIIDETLARTHFGSSNPIGRHLQLGSGLAREIVGGRGRSAG